MPIDTFGTTTPVPFPPAQNAPQPSNPSTQPQYNLNLNYYPIFNNQGPNFEMPKTKVRKVKRYKQKAPAESVKRSMPSRRVASINHGPVLIPTKTGFRKQQGFKSVERPQGSRIMPPNQPFHFMVPMQSDQDLNWGAGYPQPLGHGMLINQDSAAQSDYQGQQSLNHSSEEKGNSLFQPEGSIHSISKPQESYQFVLAPPDDYQSSGPCRQTEIRRVL